MGLEQRPYIGSWKLGTQKVVQHTPDALVYINGSLTLPGCPKCNGRINFQEFLTEVSVDAGTDAGGASASFTLSIPVHYNQSFARDAQYILRPGLEVHIYERGYFAVKGLYSNLDQPQNLTGEGSFITSGENVVPGVPSGQPSGQFGKAVTDIDQSLIPENLRPKWAAQGLGNLDPNTESGQQLTIMAGCLEVVEQSLDAKYPGVHIKVTSALREGNSDGGGSPHEKGGAADMRAYYTDSKGKERQVPPKELWATLQKLGAAGAIPNGGYGLYTDPSGGSHAGVHYDYRGSYGVRPNAPSVSWVRLDTNGDGKSDLSTEHSGGWKANALSYLRANGHAEDADYYSGGWRSDKTLVTPATNLNEVLGQTPQTEAASGNTATPQQNPSTKFTDSALQSVGMTGMDIENILAYPYYHVFHGVISSTSVSYSGGVQTVSVQCASMLRF